LVISNTYISCQQKRAQLKILPINPLNYISPNLFTLDKGLKQYPNDLLYKYLKIEVNPSTFQRANPLVFHFRIIPNPTCLPYTFLPTLYSYPRKLMGRYPFRYPEVDIGIPYASCLPYISACSYTFLAYPILLAYPIPLLAPILSLPTIHLPACHTLTYPTLTLRESI
jgi:hypothetical protein